MKTDDLIGMLSTGVEPLPRRAASRRLAWALLIGVPVAALIMAVEYGVRRDLVQAMFWPMLWAKILFPFFIGLGGFVLAQRLSRPGVRVGFAWLGLAVPLLLLWIGALGAWFSAPADERMPMLLGQTWRSCTANIMLIATPVFVTGFLAVRGLAPTRPALAGAAVGALAGGAGAAVYALHCPETGLPFMAVWYVAGMLVPVLLGAALGPRVLRW